MHNVAFSQHQFQVIVALKQNGGWMSVKEISAMTGVSARTTAQHALAFALDGTFERAAVFPAYRYRFSAEAAGRDREFCEKLKLAQDVFKDIK